MKCPAPKCPTKLNDEIVKAYLTEDRKTLYERLLAEAKMINKIFLFSVSKRRFFINPKKLLKNICI